MLDFVVSYLITFMQFSINFCLYSHYFACCPNGQKSNLHTVTHCRSGCQAFIHCFLMHVRSICMCLLKLHWLQKGTAHCRSDCQSKSKATAHCRFECQWHYALPPNACLVTNLCYMRRFPHTEACISFFTNIIHIPLNFSTNKIFNPQNFSYKFLILPLHKHTQLSLILLSYNIIFVICKVVKNISLLTYGEDR